METRAPFKENLSVYISAVLIVFLMLRYGFAACSYSTHLQANYDLNIYYLIGNAWMNGFIPYISYSDLKGPFVFLFHGLGSVLTPGCFLGICLLHAPLLGLGLLYAYKTARLFLPSASAVGAVGFYLFFLMYFTITPDEHVWVLQHVSLYFLLEWAIGERRKFSSLSLCLIGGFVAAVLLVKFNLVVFWIPICLLTIGVNRWRAFLYQMLGFGVVMLPCLIYFGWQGALQSMWEEYMATALSYGQVPWSHSALCQNHLLLFLDVLPHLLHKIFSEELMAIAGAVPCLLWIGLWQKRITAKALRPAALWCLLAAFIMLVYAEYSGKYHFSHYAFVFLPFCFLSITLCGILLRKHQKLFVVGGILSGMGILIITLLMPWYIKYGRTYNGREQMKQTARILCHRLEKVPQSDVLILDPMSSLHIKRLMKHLPNVRHFIPQDVRGGWDMFQAEQMEYIRRERPMYLLSSELNKKHAEELIGRSGVRYHALSHREAGFPAYPPHARQPELILYTRAD